MDVITITIVIITTVITTIKITEVEVVVEVMDVVEVEVDQTTLPPQITRTTKVDNSHVEDVDVEATLPTDVQLQKRHVGSIGIDQLSGQFNLQPKLQIIQTKLRRLVL